MTNSNELTDEWSPCDHCKGTGQKFPHCLKCKGKGRVYCPLPDFPAFSDCSRCENQQCGHCGGNGYVDPRPGRAVLEALEVSDADKDAGS